MSQLQFKIPNSPIPLFSGNAYFRHAASKWDSRADMQSASAEAYNALLCTFPRLLTGISRADILEIGCGTGLLSLRLAAHAWNLVAVDACDTMIAQLQKKIAVSNNFKNVLPLCLILEDAEDRRLPLDYRARGPSRMKFDLVVGHLLLHHIADVSKLLVTVYACLKPGGWAAFTDFQDFGAEARLFHPEANMSGVERHGIRKEDMEDVLVNAGFVDVFIDVAWKLKKEVERWPGEWGNEKPAGLIAETMDFPFLICVARRPLDSSVKL